MRQTLTLLTLFALPGAILAQTTHELTNVGNTFSPNVITMDAGDDIHLVLGGIHTCTEVSQATWNANGNTSNGGFNFSAGEHTFSLDVPGTYYYVCIPHAGMGMKGQIIVLPTTGVADATSAASLVLYPNPAADAVRVGGLRADQAVQVLDATGRVVLEARPTAETVLDIAALQTGNYTVAVRDLAGNVVTVKPLAVVR